MGALVSLMTAPRDVLNGGSIGVFLLITIILSGGAAFLAGRSLANDWRPLSHLFLGMVALAAGTRFLHYALYYEPLGSLKEFLISYAVVTAFSLFGYRLKQTEQMTQKYPWLYERSGLLSWKSKS